MKPLENQWSVRLGSDIYLNFYNYIGNKLGIYSKFGEKPWPLGSINLKKITKEQYASCWSDLLKMKTQNFMNGKTEWPPLTPSDFREIKDEEIREVCHQFWDEFINWWYMPAGGQYAMYYWESIPVQRFVNEYEKSISRNVRTFDLFIDLVYWGEQIENPIREYLVVPLNTEKIMDKEWWIDLFKRMEV